MGEKEDMKKKGERRGTKEGYEATENRKEREREK